MSETQCRGVQQRSSQAACIVPSRASLSRSEDDGVGNCSSTRKFVRVTFEEAYLWWMLFARDTSDFSAEKSARGDGKRAASGRALAAAELYAASARRNQKAKTDARSIEHDGKRRRSLSAEPARHLRIRQPGAARRCARRSLLGRLIRSTPADSWAATSSYVNQ